MRRRDEFTKIRIALKEIFLKSRKEHLIKKIINLLRDKSFDEIDAFETLSLLQRVDVLLSTFIVENQIFLALRKMNIRLNNLERNIAKITFILFIYAIVTKAKSMQSVEFTIVIIATYNNINQQRQLKKIKRERRVIFTLRNGSGSEPNQSGWFGCGSGSGLVFQDLETTLEPNRSVRFEPVWTRKNLYIFGMFLYIECFYI
jgi:hypothetical protein